MKRIFIIALAAALMLSLAACGGIEKAVQNAVKDAVSGAVSGAVGGGSEKSSDGAVRQTDNDQDEDQSEPTNEDTSDENGDAQGETGLDESEDTWKDNHLSQMIPKPDFGKLQYFSLGKADSYDILNVMIMDASDEDKASYIADVKEMWKDGETKQDTEYSLTICRSDWTVEISCGGSMVINIHHTVQ